MNYLGVCEAASRDGIKEAQAVASGIKQVIKRKTKDASEGSMIENTINGSIFPEASE